jgi:hypothetical protein
MLAPEQPARIASWRTSLLVPLVTVTLFDDLCRYGDPQFCCLGREIDRRRKNRTSASTTLSNFGQP